MERKVVYATHLVLEDRILQDAAIIFSDKIEHILTQEEAAQVASKESLIDEGRFEFVLPGFIDVHIHGSGGKDVMDGTPEALAHISRTITQAGTTSYLPTTMTMSEEKICKALENIRNEKTRLEAEGKTEGARILGAHLEGPFISEKFKGAQAAEHIQKPNNRWLKNYYDVVKLITMAPEEDENFEMIKEWSQRGIVVSVGHTAADYDTAVAAYEAGARHITHLFNAMTPLHHRNPGVVGAALNQPFAVEVICDGFHVHRDAVALVTRAKALEKIIMITDCMRAGFQGDGESELGGQKVYVRGDQCLLASGTIAGSILRMDQALRNLISFTELELVDAVKMLGLNAAKDLGVDALYGSISVGKFADLVFMDDAMHVKKTLVSGVTQFEEA